MQKMLIKIYIFCATTVRLSEHPYIRIKAFEISLSNLPKENGDKHWAAYICTFYIANKYRLWNKSK